MLSLIPRRFIRSFFGRLKKKWVESLVALLVGFSFALIALIWGGLFSKMKIYICDLRSISPREVMGVARQTLGAGVVEVVPFRNVDSEIQYIAVMHSESSDWRLYPPTFYVLEGLQDNYQVRKTDIHVWDMFTFYQENLNLSSYIPFVFSIIDIDKDGNKEVYSVYRDGGNAVYSFDIRVYDSLSRESYKLQGSGTYSAPFLDIELSDNAEHKTGLRSWMLEKSSKLNLCNEDCSLYTEAIRAWLRDNSKGFVEGKLTIREFQGNIPKSSASVECDINDGNFRWVSYFKGALFGYDKTRHVYFVLFVSYSRYDYVDRAVPGDRSLWFRTGQRILAFDKVDKVLTQVDSFGSVP